MQRSPCCFVMRSSQLLIAEQSDRWLVPSCFKCGVLCIAAVALEKCFVWFFR